MRDKPWTTPACARPSTVPPPAPPAVVARDAAGRVTLRAQRTAEPILLDGRLDEQVYTTVPSVSDFIQQDPHEGELATEQTEVWVFFDDRNVYISARCWDSQPDRMVANELRRDHTNLAFNENFAVVLDTFYDRRNSFMFHTNPLGGLTDALTTDERNFNKDWNTVWEVKTGRFDQGWIAEIAIPFKSLRYRAGDSQVWGINFRRSVRWKNELSYLTPIPASYGLAGISKVSEAATLVGIATPSGAKNLEIKPYAISTVTTDRTAEPAVSDDLGGELGFDVKYGLTRSLIADLTYNTDFAQVEDDEQQVNLTRFSLFFPEKREFFLEGQGIFTFGGAGQQGRPSGGFRPGQSGGPPSNIPVVFFSRRIGLADGVGIPIRAGGRLTGRVGPYSIGVLDIQTGASEAAGAPSTNFSVVRLKRNFLRRSNVGVIMTHRSARVDADGSNQGSASTAISRSSRTSISTATTLAPPPPGSRAGRGATGEPSTTPPTATGCSSSTSPSASISSRGSASSDVTTFGRARHVLGSARGSPRVGRPARSDSSPASTTSPTGRAISRAGRRRPHFGWSSKTETSGTSTTSETSSSWTKASRSRTVSSSRSEAIISRTCAQRTASVRSARSPAS